MKALAPQVASITEVVGDDDKPIGRIVQMDEMYEVHLYREHVYECGDVENGPDIDVHYTPECVGGGLGFPDAVEVITFALTEGDKP